MSIDPEQIKQAMKLLRENGWHDDNSIAITGYGFTTYGFEEPPVRIAFPCHHFNAELIGDGLWGWKDNTGELVACTDVEPYGWETAEPCHDEA